MLYPPGLGSDFGLKDLIRALESARKEAVFPPPCPAGNQEETISGTHRTSSLAFHQPTRRQVLPSRELQALPDLQRDLVCCVWGSPARPVLWTLLHWALPAGTYL